MERKKSHDLEKWTPPPKRLVLASSSEGNCDVKLRTTHLLHRSATELISELLALSDSATKNGCGICSSIHTLKVVMYVVSSMSLLPV